MSDGKGSNVRYYRDLVVWQRGIELAKDVYRVTGSFPTQENYGLTHQLRRAAVSVPSNIAEGQARRHPREFSRYLRIALGSLAEVDTQLVIGCELGYLSSEQFAGLDQTIGEVRKMLYGLIQSIQPPTHN